MPENTYGESWPAPGPERVPPDDDARLRPEDVTHTQHYVGRGASGIVRRGTLRLPSGGGTVAVAIKELAPGATAAAERRFIKEFKVALRASRKCSRACRMYGCVRRDAALCLVREPTPPRPTVPTASRAPCSLPRAC